MNHLTTLLLIAGTIVGTFGGAKLPEADWLVTGIGVALLVVAGIIRVTTAKKSPAASAGDTAGANADVVSLMRALPARLQPIVDDAERLTLEQIGERIGELDADYFRAIADGAPALLGPMGVERFAEVFGLYASGERMISRAWSASVDHHRPETQNSLRDGTAKIREAVAALDAAKAA